MSIALLPSVQLSNMQPFVRLVTAIMYSPAASTGSSLQPANPAASPASRNRRFMEPRITNNPPSWPVLGLCSQNVPRRRTRAYHHAAAALAVSLGASAAATGAAVQDVETFRLDNGLTLHVAGGHPAPVFA